MWKSGLSTRPKGSHFLRRTLLSKISIHIVKVCWPNSPNWSNSHKITQICSKLHKVAQICSKLRKVAKIHTKSLKVAQICPKLHKVTQICPNYTLIENLLKKVRHEKCDPWSRQVWSNLQTKPLQLSICWYFAQKSATCKVWPTNYIELKN